MPRTARAGLTALGLALALASDGQAPPGHPAAAAEPRPYAPKVAPASDEAAKAARTFQAPPGVAVELFAAEPLLANPVAFCVDARGRFYVAETFRLTDGVLDTRNYMQWLDDDLAARTVADRVAMYRKYLPADTYARFQVEQDRVKLVEDRDGDGVADDSAVYADGFGKIADGLGAGVLAHRGDVYYTCIPDLWKLRDVDGDGKADERTSLSSGYGVHVAFIGHDLHGLRIGPDGRLYFTVGDRGLHVVTPEGTVSNPDSGAVLRCNLDGTGLELFATGLRNPQELAFDEFGNLFTADNNSDGGDKARWVYLVEGGDSGWRIGYQYIESPVSRGPWNAEKLWDPEMAAKAPYLVPPIANLGDGPSGLTYHPGTSRLPAKYKGHFFLADFRGTAGNSGIRSFGVRPNGASFDLVDSEKFVWSTLATDVDFAPDGALYVSDWVAGWEKPGKGRLWRVADPGLAADPAVAEVKALIGGGLDGKSVADLATLLGHADARVRQEAQFALVAKGDEGATALGTASLPGRPLLARLHAIWGIGQLIRAGKAPGFPIVGYLADPELEVRVQAARVAGDARLAGAFDGLVKLLRDESPRVRSIAAVALGRLGRREAAGPALAMLRDDAGRDPVVRHAGVMALVGSKDEAALNAASGDASTAVRMGALLAYRRLANPAVAGFLYDDDPALVLEAARAINDAPIEGATARLAALADRDDLPEPLLRRVLNANIRIGNAKALAAIALRGSAPNPARVEALDALASWARPPGRDRVMGLWRPIAPRDAAPAALALRDSIRPLLADAPDRVAVAALKAASTLKVSEAGPLALGIVESPGRRAELRVQALKTLADLGDAGLAAVAARAVEDADASVRTAGRDILARLDPAQALKGLETVLDRGTIPERQGALATLGTIKNPAATALLSTWLDRLLAGGAPAEVELDILDAAARRGDDALRSKLAQFESSRPKDDPASAYRECLTGGNAARGREVFLKKAEVACLRCHKVEGAGGEVGPELTGVGTRVDRRYLVESIVAPNAKIAQGFETLVVATRDGVVHTGILKKDDGGSLTLIDADAKLSTIPKADIEEQARGASAMPADIVTKLSRGEIRDLVEFLATVR